MLVATKSVANACEAAALIPITGKTVMDARITHDFDSHVLRTMQVQLLDASRLLCCYRSLNYPKFACP